MKKIIILLIFICLTKLTSAIPCWTAMGYSLTVTNTTSSSIQIFGNFSGTLTVCTNNNFTTGCILTNTPFTAGSLTITGLTPNITYYIRVNNTANTCGMTTSASTISCGCTYTKPNTPTIPIVNCKLVKIDWTLNPCAKYYELGVGPDNANNINNYPAVYNVGKNSTYSITSLTGFPVGTYKCRIRYRYIDCADNIEKWSEYSDKENFKITNTPADAGPDKSMPVCTTGINGIQLQATAISGGKWSVVSSTPAGYTGNFYGSDTDPNAYFQFSNYGANSYTLKWGNECNSDIMIVYTSFACGTNLIDTRDGKTYTTKSYNGKCWFTKNLNYGEQISWAGGQPANYNALTNDVPWPATNSTIRKYCQNNVTANCTAYGGLYLGDVAALSELCPPCWHVGTNDDWTSLINYASSYPGTGNAATKLNGGTLSFNALNTNSTVSGTSSDGYLNTGFVRFTYGHMNNLGYSTIGNANPLNFYKPITNPVILANYNGAFNSHGTGRIAMYWTSTYFTAGNAGLYFNRYGASYSGTAYFREFAGAGANSYYQNDAVYAYWAPRRENAFHVRCVKN